MGENGPFYFFASQDYFIFLKSANAFLIMANGQKPFGGPHKPKNDNRYNKNEGQKSNCTAEGERNAHKKRFRSGKADSAPDMSAVMASGTGPGL